MQSVKDEWVDRVVQKMSKWSSTQAEFAGLFSSLTVKEAVESTFEKYNNINEGDRRYTASEEIKAINKNIMEIQADLEDTDVEILDASGKVIDLDSKLRAQLIELNAKKLMLQDIIAQPHLPHVQAQAAKPESSQRGSRRFSSSRASASSISVKEDKLREQVLKTQASQSKTSSAASSEASSPAVSRRASQAQVKDTQPSPWATTKPSQKDEVIKTSVASAPTTPTTERRASSSKVSFPDPRNVKGSAAALQGEMKRELDAIKNAAQAAKKDFGNNSPAKK